MKESRIRFSLAIWNLVWCLFIMSQAKMIRGQVVNSPRSNANEIKSFEITENFMENRDSQESGIGMPISEITPASEDEEEEIIEPEPPAEPETALEHQTHHQHHIHRHSHVKLPKFIYRHHRHSHRHPQPPSKEHDARASIDIQEVDLSAIQLDHDEDIDIDGPEQLFPGNEESTEWIDVDLNAESTGVSNEEYLALKRQMSFENVDIPFQNSDVLDALNNDTDEPSSSVDIDSFSGDETTLNYLMSMNQENVERAQYLIALDNRLPPRPQTHGLAIRFRQEKGLGPLTDFIMDTLFEEDQWETIAHFLMPEYLIIHNRFPKVAVSKTIITNLGKPSKFVIDLLPDGVLLQAEKFSFGFETDMQMHIAGGWQHVGHYRVKCDAVDFSAKFMPEIKEEMIVDGDDLKIEKRFVVHIIHADLKFQSNLDVTASRLGPVSTLINLAYKVIHYFFSKQLHELIKNRLVHFLRSIIPSFSREYAYMLVGTLLGLGDNFLHSYYDIESDLEHDFVFEDALVKLKKGLAVIRTNIKLRNFPEVIFSSRNMTQWFIDKPPKHWNHGADKNVKVDFFNDPPIPPGWYKKWRKNLLTELERQQGPFYSIQIASRKKKWNPFKSKSKKESAHSFVDPRTLDPLPSLSRMRQPSLARLPSLRRESSVPKGWFSWFFGGNHDMDYQGSRIRRFNSLSVIDSDDGVELPGIEDLRGFSALDSRKHEPMPDAQSLPKKKKSFFKQFCKKKDKCDVVAVTGDDNGVDLFYDAREEFRKGSKWWKFRKT